MCDISKESHVRYNCIACKVAQAEMVRDVEEKREEIGKRSTVALWQCFQCTSGKLLFAYYGD